jgi:hypothetical protein
MVTVKADNRRRVQLPDAKSGQVFVYVANADGTLLLSPVKAVERKPGILDGLKPLTKEECERCWGPQTDGSENDLIAAAMSKVPPPRPEDLE